MFKQILFFVLMMIPGMLVFSQEVDVATQGTEVLDTIVIKNRQFEFQGQKLEADNILELVEGDSVLEQRVYLAKKRLDLSSTVMVLGIGGVGFSLVLSAVDNMTGGEDSWSERLKIRDFLPYLLIPSMGAVIFSRVTRISGLNLLTMSVKEYNAAVKNRTKKGGAAKCEFNFGVGGNGLAMTVRF